MWLVHVRCPRRTRARRRQILGERRQGVIGCRRAPGVQPLPSSFESSAIAIADLRRSTEKNSGDLTVQATELKEGGAERQGRDETLWFF